MALTLTEQLADEWMLLNAEERQQVFFEYVPKTLSVWGVQGENGWVMSANEQGDENLPIWSHELLATKWLTAHHPEAKPMKISLNEFKTTWLPGLNKNTIGLIISPSHTQEDSVVMTAEECLDAFS